MTGSGRLLRFPRRKQGRPLGATPIAHGDQDRDQRAAEFGQAVFDLGRHFRIDHALDDAVAFQLAQLQGQHALGHAGKLAAQFAEPLGAIHQVEQNHRLPAPADHFERGGNLAIMPVGPDPARHSILHDTTAQNCAYLSDEPLHSTLPRSPMPGRCGAMRAAYYQENGPARTVLKIGEQPTPEPGPGEVRVRVMVSGVNPSDVKTRRGGGRAPGFPLTIPHSDGAGIIDAVGAGVDPTRIGERVWLWNGQWRRPFGTAAEVVSLPAAPAVAAAASPPVLGGARLGLPALASR